MAKIVVFVLLLMASNDACILLRWCNKAAAHFFTGDPSRDKAFLCHVIPSLQETQDKLDEHVKQHGPPLAGIAEGSPHFLPECTVMPEQYQFLANS